MNCTVMYCDFNESPTFRPKLYGDDDLGRAMTLCEAHTLPITAVYPEGGHPHPGYRQGWEACGKVLAAWKQSETARQQREAEEQAARDKAWVEEFARGLK